MPFNESITQFTTETSNHADNFNEVHNKLLENDKFLKTDLSNQISILSTDISRRQIRTYTSLSAIGLTDVQFAGLTQIQAFDLLTEYMGYNSYLTILLTSGVPNFRQAIMQDRLDAKNVMKFEFEVGGSRVFHAYAGNGIGVFLECSGGISMSSGWKQLATTHKTDISFPYLENSDYIDSGNGAESSIISRKNNRVTIVANIKTKSGNPFVASTSTILGKLPVGFRPLSNIRTLSASNNPYGSIGSLFITFEGDIVLRAVTANTKHINFITTFDVD